MHAFLVLLLAALGCSSAPAPSPIAEKRSRTPAQQKIDSQLLQAIQNKRGEGLRVKFDEKHRALVTIRAYVTPELLATIKKSGGLILSSSVEYHDIRAHVPLSRIEPLAKRKDVIAILPLEEAVTNNLR